jgi:hypothetical protein
MPFVKMTYGVKARVWTADQLRNKGIKWLEEKELVLPQLLVKLRTKLFLVEMEHTSSIRPKFRMRITPET